MPAIVLDASVLAALQTDTFGSSDNLTYIGMAMGVVFLTLILVIFVARKCSTGGKSGKGRFKSLQPHDPAMNNIMQQYALSLQQQHQNGMGQPGGPPPPGGMKGSRQHLFDPWDGAYPLLSSANGEYNIIGGGPKENVIWDGASEAGGNLAAAPGGTAPHNMQMPLDQQAWLTRQMGTRFFPDHELRDAVRTEELLSNGESFHPSMQKQISRPKGMAAKQTSQHGIGGEGGGGGNNPRSPNGAKRDRRIGQKQAENRAMPSAAPSVRPSLVDDDEVVGLGMDIAAAMAIADAASAALHGYPNSMPPTSLPGPTEEPIYGMASEGNPLTMKPKKGKGKAKAKAKARARGSVHGNVKATGGGPQRRAARKAKKQQQQQPQNRGGGDGNVVDVNYKRASLVQARLQHDMALSAPFLDDEFWPAEDHPMDSVVRGDLDAFNVKVAVDPNDFIEVGYHEEENATEKSESLYAEDFIMLKRKEPSLQNADGGGSGGKGGGKGGAGEEE